MIRSVASLFASIAAVASMGVSDLKADVVDPGRANIGQGHTLTGTQATIAGGQTNTASATRATVAGGLLNEALISDSFVGGGAKNKIAGGGTNSTISGGFGNNMDSCDFGAIGGGGNNTLGIPGTATSASVICGGFSNLNKGTVSAIVGGSFNSISNYVLGAVIVGGTGQGIGGNVGSVAQTIGGGRSNNVSVSGATIAGGVDNSVHGTLGTVPGGYRASASHYGQLAYASGFFGARGDAQSSLYVARTTTTSATATELFLDGSSERMTIPSGSTWIFEIQVVARSATQSAGYTAKGVIDNFSGTVGLLAGSVTVVGEDDMNWDLQLEASNGALVLKGVGAASTTIRWVATIRTTEVTN
jgi:hypothetical protein